MTLIFEPNEFTVSELLYYFKGAFRTMINGAPFQHYHIANWIRRRQLPMAYGGHKILSSERISSLGNQLVVKVDGLKRDVLEDVKLYMKIEPIKPPLSARERPRKQRTKLYYQILDKLGKQYTRKTKAAATLPDDYKAMGMKQNQMPRRKSKSKNSI